MARVRSTEKSDYAYKCIRNMIINHELIPEETLSEQNLSQQIGVSRTPIRNALQRLLNEGFVESTPDKGLIAAHVRLLDMLEIIETRLPLDSLAFELAASRMNRNEIERLGETSKHLERVAQTEKLGEIIQWDEQYQVSVIQGSKNKMLIDILKNLLSKSTRGISTSTYTLEQIRSDVSIHKQTYEALQKQEGKLAASLQKKYLENLIQFLKYIAVENFYTFR